MSDNDGLTYLLLLPESVQGKVDDVASLIHFMNANTFTSAVLHLKEGTAADVAKEIETAVMGNQFMCGFPEKLIIVQISDDYLVSAFGHGEPIDLFKSKLSEAYPEAEFLFEEPIE